MEQAFWERNAESWTLAIRKQVVETRKVTNPAIIHEILSRKPETVLDLGCGEGWIGSALAAYQIEYTGVDFSLTLVERAKQLLPAARIEQRSYDELICADWPEEKSFDIVIFNFSLFDDDIRHILKWATSRLKASGTLLIQTLHPCFALVPYADGWKTEDFASFPVPFEGTMNWYGRTLASWITCLSEGGLSLISLKEPTDSNNLRPLSLILAAGVRS